MTNKTRTNRIHSSLTVDGRTLCGHTAGTVQVSANADEVSCGVCLRYVRQHANPDKANIGFHSSVSVDGQYAKLEISIYWLEDVLNSFAHRDECVTVSFITGKEYWQEDKQPESGHAWFGSTVEIKATSWTTTEKLHRLARTVLSDVLHAQTSPASVMVKLRNIGAVEVIYDGRLHSFTPVTALLPETVGRWLDDYRVLGRDSVTISALAETEEEARTNLAEDIKIGMERGWVSQDWVDQWEAAGRPVFREQAIQPTYVRAETRIITNPFTRKRK